MQGEEVKELKTPEEVWMDGIIEETNEKAKELEAVLNCEITPFVFVVEPLKDAAVGFFRMPDAKQSLKIFRSMVTDQDLGAELCAKAQLVREYNGAIASDPRFMDVNGNYDKKYSGLNFSLLLKAQSIIEIFRDQFKKK